MTDTPELLQPGKTYKVPMKNGYLEIIASFDKDYPGLDIEFIPDKYEMKTNPRVLIEQDNYDKKEDEPATLRALIWDNPGLEDYTKELILLENCKS